MHRMVWNNDGGSILDGSIEIIHETKKSIVIKVVYSLGEKTLYYEKNEITIPLLENFKKDNDLTKFLHFISMVNPYRSKKWGIVNS